ncbi:MAG: hypothetical protein Q9166_007289 [cf. Caloplaca sp. 2 TL-2023]
MTLSAQSNVPNKTITDHPPTNGPAPAIALRITTIPKPCPTTRTTALVRIKAFGLNGTGLLQRMGMYPVPPQAPSTLGVEFFRV